MKVDSTQEILLEAKDLKQDESFLRKVERSGKTLVYSLFKEADNQDAIDLDKKSTMFSMLGGLIKAGRNFSDRYEEKLLKYKEGFIIVCRCVGDPVEAGEKKKAKEHDQSNKGFLCGKTNVAMKEIYFNGKLVKAGYIFDLRVDDEYQRLKIASDIVDLAKERLTKEGCEIFYSYTNYNNIKSMAFHERNGFKISSSRALFSHMYSKGAFSPVEETTVVEGKTVKFERSDSASGRMKTDKYYKEKQEDLYLKDFSEIQALEGNDGFYMVSTTDGESYAGAHSYIDNGEGSVRAKRIIFPVEYFESNLFNIFFMIILSLLPLGLFLALRYGGNVSLLISGCVCLGINLGVWLAYLKFVSLVRKLSGSCLRIIAPFYVGEDKYKTGMMHFLFKNLMRISTKKGAHSIRINVDERDPFRDMYPAAWGKVTRSCFLILHLEKSTAKEVVQFSKGCLFDPRDV